MSRGLWLWEAPSVVFDEVWRPQEVQPLTKLWGEALGSSTIRILRVPKLPGAQNSNSGGLGAAILDTFITSGGLEPPPRETASSWISQMCSKPIVFS